MAKIRIKVEELLKEYNITNKKEFAIDCGIHPSTLYKLPNRKMIRLTTLAKICYNLDATPNELLEVIDDE